MKITIRIIGLLIIALLQLYHVRAQKNVQTHLGNHEKRGDKLFHHFSYNQAMDAYTNALENKEDDRIKLKIAECYRLLNDTKNTADWYSKVIENPEVISPIHKFYYAEALSSNGEYEKAKLWYQEFCNEAKDDRRGMNKFQAVGNIHKYYMDSAAYGIEKVDVNSELADFAPAYYQNGLVFVSERNTNGLVKSVYNRREQAFLDLFYTAFDENGNTTKPQKFHKKVNTKFHEGPVTFYNENRNIIFTRNNYYQGKERKSKDGINKLKLFSAERSPEGGWTNIQPLPFNNDEYSVGHPAISADGKRLYFSSDMPGGLGGTDIYVSNFENETWTAPVNLGPDINTEGNEMFPFLTEKNTLYFASNGWEGLGGLDIFKSEIVAEGFTPPYNIGHPINSRQDDFALAVNLEGTEGYFSSRRPGGIGDDDIYKVLFKHVTVETELMAEGAGPIGTSRKVIVVDKITGRQLPTYQENGKVVFQGTPGRSYQVIAIVNDSDVVTQDLTIEEGQKKSERKLVKLPFNYTEDKNKVFFNDPKFQVFALNDLGETNAQVQVDDLDAKDLKLIEVGSGKETPFEFRDGEISFTGKPKGKYLLKLREDEKETDLFLIQSPDQGLDEAKISFPVVKGNKEEGAGSTVVIVKHHEDSIQYFMASKDGKLETIPSLGQLPPETSTHHEGQGGVFVINNIYYDLDKYEIREDAEAELDKIIGLMKKYLNLQLVLTSHTDSRASNSYNDRLSKKRSMSVSQYLVKRQVPGSRITTNHHGEKELVNDCIDNNPCSEENHQLNRRTEFQLIINK